MTSVLLLEKFICISFEISHIELPSLLRLFTAVQLNCELSQEHLGWEK